MFRNFVTIAIRNLQRQFLYSFINILGLAVGMACSLVMLLYVYGEWSHDRHFENGDRIYRVGMSFFGMGEFAVAPELMAEHLPKQFEGIKSFTQFQKDGEGVISVGEKSFREVVYHVDSAFFDVFSYEAVAGNLHRALSNPYSIALTESVAIKYFGETNVVGKNVEFGKDKKPYAITAVVKDQYQSSHLTAKIWVSNITDTFPNKFWGSASSYTYLLLHENNSQQDLEQAIDRLIANEVFPTFGKQMGKQTLEEYLQDPNSIKFHVLPLRDIYLKSKVNFELSPGGNETNMLIFTIIAGFILLLAAVNFINLSTARATRRAKEVGIRKSLGTSKSRLIAQFLTESLMLSLISMSVALCLAELFTLAFFWVTGETLATNIWMYPYAWITVLVLTIFIGVAAGLYPAFYLTAFSPMKVLKGNIRGVGGAQFRNSLVVLQFTISICLIICTTIIVRQLSFMSTKDLGFDQENVITIDNMHLIKNPFTFRDEILKHPDVISATMHSGEPGSKSSVSTSILKTETMDQPQSFFTFYGDENLQKVMGYELVDGRWFDTDHASDSVSVILNESAVSALGITGNPIGIKLNDGFIIIGVVRDFHWETLRNSIAPVAFMYENEKPRRINRLSQLGVKIQASKAQAFIDFSTKKWNERSPDEPIQFHFLDENFGELLKKEAVFGKAIGFFTVLAIFISCLGLFGLSAYTTEQRTKEIGIRKALGATVMNIVLMLNTHFAKLVLIAIGIAIPLAMLASGRWLEQYAYKTEVEFWIYLAGSVIALIICCATVAFHSAKASKTNPADTLKCE